MRTINERIYKRLVAQAEEAEVQGLTKVASHLTDQIEKVSVRKDDESYTYAESDLQSDVESALWSAAVRFSDFHNIVLNASETQDLIEKFANEILSELRASADVQHGVGAYEPTVPGEARERVVISLNEEE